MKEIAIVEDEPSLRELVTDLLSGLGVGVTAYARVAEAEAALAARLPDVLVTDIKLPDGDGLQLLDRLRRQGFRGPAVVMTAFGTVERAVQALRAGASDFLVKPFDNHRLVAAVAAALERGRELEEVELSAGTVRDASQLAKDLIGAEGGLRDVVSLLPRVAASDATVLIHGESGTGKELVARAIHNLSPRLDGPFVSLNCGAIPPTLLESELFGFERGAFTGAHAARKGHVEAADGGTLFLDEIGDMSLEAQVRLLRVLQEREITRVGGRTPIAVDVRVVAATHHDLAQRVDEGAFREDLMYRLAVVPIELPPLRDRRQDLPGLVEHFLERATKKLGHELRVPTAEEMAKLAAHAWPGNVRELENFVERAVVFGRWELGTFERRTAPPVVLVPDVPVRTLKEAVAEAERGAVVAALRASGNNKAQAARLLGVSYKTLFNKINEHGIKEDVRIE